MTKNKQSLSLLAEALQAQRFLLVWADVPFPPEDRPSRNPALTIPRWQEDACALPLLPFDFAHGKPWPLVGLPPLPILSLDPSERVENAFTTIFTANKIGSKDMIVERSSVSSPKVSKSSSMSPNRGLSYSTGISWTIS